jgi:hypothetical protein
MFDEDNGQFTKTIHKPTDQYGQKFKNKPNRNHSFERTKKIPSTTDKKASKISYRYHTFIRLFFYCVGQMVTTSEGLLVR